MFCFLFFARTFKRDFLFVKICLIDNVSFFRECFSWIKTSFTCWGSTYFQSDHKLLNHPLTSLKFTLSRCVWSAVTSLPTYMCYNLQLSRLSPHTAIRHFFISLVQPPPRRPAASGPAAAARIREGICGDAVFDTTFAMRLTSLGTRTTPKSARTLRLWWGRLLSDRKP